MIKYCATVIVALIKILLLIDCFRKLSIDNKAYFFSKPLRIKNRSRSLRFFRRFSETSIDTEL